MTLDPNRPKGIRGTVRTTNPESIAMVLSIVVLIAIGGIAATLLGKDVADGQPGASPTRSDRPASPAPSASAGPARSPTAGVPQASPTRPAWSTLAASILDTDQRLVEVADELDDALDDDAPTSSLVSRFRSANALLMNIEARIRSAADAGLATDLATELAAIHDTAADIVSTTLDASIQNAAVYRDGAADLVKALAPLPDLMERLARASGLPEPTAAP